MMFRVDPSSRLDLVPRTTAANRRVVATDLSLAVIGRGSVIGAFCAIYRGVEIGEDCRVGDHATIREGCRIGQRCIIGTNVDVQYGCQIGDDVRLMNGAHLTGGTIIGNGSFISAGVMTANHRHVDLQAYDVPSQGYSAPVIGRGVMVGLAAIILPGVTIGDFAVIAAGAVVTKSVGKYETVAGIPARADWRAVQHALAAE